MSKLKKRIIVSLICTACAAAAITVLSRTGNNFVSNGVNTVLSPMGAMAQRVTQPVKNCFTFLAEMKGLKEENELLKSELNTLKKESRSKEEYKKENTRLKRLLNLTDELDNCETVPAKIVSFEQDNWFYSVMINKGEKDGIKLSDVVITENGLVGKISEVGYNWARVSTILDPKNAIGVKLTRTGDVGIAEGDTELLKKHRLKLGYVSKNTSLISGDLLETSGLGGIYPPGISVGTVEEVRADTVGESSNGILKPSVDFDNLYEVVVVTYWETAVFNKESLRTEYAAENARESGRNPNSVAVRELPEEDTSDEETENESHKVRDDASEANEGEVSE